MADVGKKEDTAAMMIVTGQVTAALVMRDTETIIIAITTRWRMIIPMVPCLNCHHHATRTSVTKTTTVVIIRTTPLVVNITAATRVAGTPAMADMKVEEEEECLVAIITTAAGQGKKSTTIIAIIIVRIRRQGLDLTEDVATATSARTIVVAITRTILFQITRLIQLMIVVTARQFDLFFDFDCR